MHFTIVVPLATSSASKALIASYRRSISSGGASSRTRAMSTSS